VLVSLAPRGRPGRRRERPHHPGPVHARRRRGGHAPHRARDRLRRDPARTPREGVHRQRAGLGDPTHSDREVPGERIVKRAFATAAAPVFAALGDETRLRLLARVSGEGPLSITRLSEGAPVTRQAVTKHLRVLEQAGLVRAHRRGRETLWQIEPKRLDDAQRYLETVASEWDARLERFKRMIESD